MPTMSWTFNGEVLKSSAEIVQSYNGRTAKLMFIEVYPDDAGVYECVGKNNNGEVKTSAKLTVIGTSPCLLSFIEVARVAISHARQKSKGSLWLSNPPCTDVFGSLVLQPLV